MHLNHQSHENIPGDTKVGDHCSKHFLGVECFFHVPKCSFTFTASVAYGEEIALLPIGMSVFFSQN